MKKYKINLLAKKKPKFTKTFIYFVLHYLRYIVIITQIVVIAVFFYRFKIDQQIVDLRENVNQKQEIIRATLPIVAEAKEVETRADEIKKILNQGDKFGANLNYVFSVIPVGVTIDIYNINEKTISFSGESVDIRTIQLFDSKLKSDNRFKSILISFVSKTITGYEFAMQLSID